MTKEKIIAAYFYYKGRYGNTVIMFRIGNEYQTFFDDARRVFNTLKVPLKVTSPETGGLAMVALPVDSILDDMDELSLHGMKSKLITYRNDAGEYDFPDVLELTKEEIEDYE